MGKWRSFYVDQKDQTADIFTKSLGRVKFDKFRNELGICSREFLDQRGHC